MKFVILTGMSGAGKSTAIKMMEDIGYYCVDNLPIALLEKFVELSSLQENAELQKVAVGIDIRNGQALEEIRDVLARIKKKKVHYEILFLDALCGQEVVFYETVKDTAYPGEIVASHTDLSDLAQTICFPEEPSTTTTETTETTETSETSETTVAGTSTQVIPTKEQAVKTGDEANLFLTILVLCTSAVGIGMGLIGRKRSHKQK